MKITQKIMMVALITSVLSGSAYAVYDADNQATTSLSDLKDVGLASPKKLSITRAGIDAVLDERFDSTQGANDGAKNAKAFLHGVVVGTVDLFDGGDAATKRTAFLAALDNVLAMKNPLELDITVAGFNPALPASGYQITEVSDMLLAAITPIDRRESLLRQAHALRINSTSATGESVEDLLYELSSAAVGGHRQAVLAKVEAANFGKKGKTLADKVAARLAKHAFGGKYSDMGLEGNDAAIGAFHTHLEQAKREGAAAVTMTPADREMIELGQRVKMMFEGSEGIASDGMLEQISQLQRMNSHLMAELMRLRDIAKQTELSSTATAKPRPSGSGSDCDDEDKMGLFD